MCFIHTEAKHLFGPPLLCVLLVGTVISMHTSTVFDTIINSFIFLCGPATLQKWKFEFGLVIACSVSILLLGATIYQYISR